MTHSPYLKAEDNGTIWLLCECGWTKGLGYTTTATDAWAAEQAHLREVGALTTRPPYGTLVFGGDAIKWVPDTYAEEPWEEPVDEPVESEDV